MYVWSERTESSREGNKNIIPSSYYLYEFHEVKVFVEKPCTILVNDEVVHVNKNLNIYINNSDTRSLKLNNHTRFISDEYVSTHINSKLGKLTIVEEGINYYWTGLFH